MNEACHCPRAAKWTQNHALKRKLQAGESKTIPPKSHVTPARQSKLNYTRIINGFVIRDCWEYKHSYLSDVHSIALGVVDTGNWTCSLLNNHVLTTAFFFFFLFSFFFFSFYDNERVIIDEASFLKSFKYSLSGSYN